MTVKKRVKIQGLLALVSCLTRKQVYADIRAARYPARRVGRDWIIDEDAAITYYNGQLDQPTQQAPQGGRSAFDEFNEKYFGGSL